MLHITYIKVFSRRSKTTGMHRHTLDLSRFGSITDRQEASTGTVDILRNEIHILSGLHFNVTFEAVDADQRVSQGIQFPSAKGFGLT